MLSIYRIKILRNLRGGEKGSAGGKSGGGFAEKWWVICGKVVGDSEVVGDRKNGSYTTFCGYFTGFEGWWWGMQRIFTYFYAYSITHSVSKDD